MQENTIPWVIKAVPAVVGAILALVLSGKLFSLIKPDPERSGFLLSKF